jgi:hypothetical protein
VLGVRERSREHVPRARPGSPKSFRRPDRAGDSAPPRGRRYYQGRPYVSEAQFISTLPLKPNVGVFYDRDGSLASLIFQARRQDRVLVNLYPGVVQIAGWSPGLWAHWVDGSRVRFGIATTWGPGIGADS